MTPLPPEMMAELQKEYLESFTEPLAEIREKLKLKDWKTIRFHFHKFAGSGGTYGLHDITEIGRAVEHYIDTAQNPSPETLMECIHLFENVINAYKDGKVLNANAKNEVLRKIVA